MSTRACIKIKEKACLNDLKEELTDCVITLYHHHDGYPEGVGSDLKQYIEETVSKWACGWDSEIIATELVRGVIKDSDGEPDMGYQVAICEHADCEYGYEIDCDKQTLKCYELIPARVCPWRESWEVPIPDKQQD